MNDLIKKEDENNKYIIKYDSTHNLPKPFERFIFLLETTVAGTTRIKDIDKIIDSLNIRDDLILYREPDNPNDKHAIRIETINKEKIGYVPRQNNVVISRLMDAGKKIVAEVTEIESRGNWFRILFAIFLHES